MQVFPIEVIVRDVERLQRRNDGQILERAQPAIAKVENFGLAEALEEHFVVLSELAGQV